MGAPIDEALVEKLIASVPRMRELYDPVRHAQLEVVISGRPDAWATTATAVQRDGVRIAAFHDIRGEQAERELMGAPVLRGRIPSHLAHLPVLFAGRPSKGWFNPSPPGPERCLFHVSPVEWQRRGRHTPELWRDEARSRMLGVFAMLADEPSRRALASIVRARTEGDSGYHRISPYLEYDHPVVRAEAGDTVIDGGAYDGDVSTLFAERVGADGRVYALEPEPGNYQRLSSVALAHQNIIPICAGLWREDAKLAFAAGARASSKIDRDGGTTITVTSVDRLVALHRIERVDLIKLDVEGAELAALVGAERTIRAHRPKLQISIYHRPADLYELPELLRQWLPRYRFYLGHHNYYQTETDLYAIPLERWIQGRARRMLRRASERGRARLRRLLRESGRTNGE